MKSNIYMSYVFLLILLFGSLKSCNTSPREDRIDLRLDWFLNMSFAGEIVALKDVSKDYQLEFNIYPAMENIDPIKMVLSGQNNFGVVSADKFLTAVEQGAEIAAIGVKNPISPVVFVSKKERGILTPYDFINKRVGVLPGGSTEFIYRTLLHKHSISITDLTEINIPFDLATFITGRYDIRPAFIYDEPVTLENEGIAINILNPADFGVSYIGGVYFTTKRLINNNPQLVQTFVDIMAESWTIALNDPYYAIKLLLEKETSTSFDRELMSLKKGIDYFRTEKGDVLVFNRKNWELMIDNLHTIGILNNIIEYDVIVDDTFINNYYNYSFE